MYYDITKLVTIITVLSACQRNASRRLITNIAKALQEVTSKWFEIAILLGIPVDKLNTIKENHSDGRRDLTAACLTAMIEVNI